MTGILNAAIATAWSQPSIRVNPVLEVAWPDTTSRYCSDWCPFANDDNGTYAALVEQWSTRKRDIDRKGGLLPVTMTVRLRDPQQRISKLRAGSYAPQVEGSAVKIRLAVPESVAAATAWPTVFAGQVEQLEPAGARRWQLSLRPPDVKLRRPAPKRPFHKGDWPYGDSGTQSSGTGGQKSSIFDSFWPVVFGTWDSRSVGRAGALPTYCVDIRGGNNRHFISQGWIRSLFAVYDNGAKVGTSLYTLERGIRNGRAYSAVKKNAGAWDGPVTVDCEGLTADGTATGTLIDNPADILSVWLNAFVFTDDYTSGAFPTTAAPINAAYLAAARAFFERYGVKGVLRSASSGGGPGSRSSASDQLNRFISSFTYLKSFWTFRSGSAEIAFRAQDFTQHAYLSAPWHRYLLNETVTERYVQYLRHNRIDRVSCKYLVNAVSGGTALSLQVRDPALGYDAGDDLVLDSLRAAL